MAQTPGIDRRADFGLSHAACSAEQRRFAVSPPALPAVGVLPHASFDPVWGGVDFNTRHRADRGGLTRAHITKPTLPAPAGAAESRGCPPQGDMAMLSDAETGAALAAMQAHDGSSELRLLLIGATGNVGQHCLTKLLEDAAESGEPVKLLVATRDPEGFWAAYRHPRRCPAVVEPVKCDAGDPGSLAAVIAATAPTRVFISMAQALSPEAMVACGQACVDACAAAGVSRLVRLSSLGIDKPPGQGPLGDAHLTIETPAAEKAPALPVVSVRPTSFHTNLLAYDADSIRTESCFRSPLGSDAKVNWVHCKDTGSVCAVALGKPDGDAAVQPVIDVTGPPESTLGAADMAALLSEELGRPIVYEEVAPLPFPGLEALWGFLKAGGFDASSDSVEQLTGKPPMDFRAIVNEAKPQLSPPADL